MLFFSLFVSLTPYVSLHQLLSTFADCCSVLHSEPLTYVSGFIPNQVHSCPQPSSQHEQHTARRHQNTPTTLHPFRLGLFAIPYMAMAIQSMDVYGVWPSFYSTIQSTFQVLTVWYWWFDGCQQLYRLLKTRFNHVYRFKTSV